MPGPDPFRCLKCDRQATHDVTKPHNNGASFYDHIGGNLKWLCHDCLVEELAMDALAGGSQSDRVRRILEGLVSLDELTRGL